MRFFKAKSVLIQYLVSYILIVFLASFFFGMLIFIFSINRILEANVHVAQTKLDFISSDLETQLEIMQDIVYDIHIGLYYKPAYFLRNKYYETELLENFSKYGTYSSLIDEYFLYYRESSVLYRGSGSTIDPVVFVENIIGGKDPALWPRIESTAGNEALFISRGDKNLFFFLFPVSIISSYQDVYSNEALAGFIFDEETLKRRIIAISGMANTPLVFYFQDMPLIRLFGETEGVDFSLSFKEQLAAKNTKKLVFSRSPKGSFQIIMARENIEGNSLVQSYRNTLVLTIGIIVAVLCFAGVYMAYMNYKPIKNLETSIGDNALPKKAGYEFETITDAFKKLKDEESQNHRIIQGQINSLRRQMVDIILGGGYNSGVQSKSWEMGIVLEGPWFGIAAVRVDRNSRIDEAGLWEILEGIEIPGTAIYYGNLNADNSFSILLDYFNEPSVRNSAARFLYGKCTDRGLCISVGVGPVIKNLSRISDALLEAHKALQESVVSGEGVVFCEEIPGCPGEPGNSENWVEDFSRALKKRELSKSAAALDGLTSSLSARNRSVIYQRSVYYHVLSVMVNIARETKFTIQQEWISNILKSTSPDDFRKNVLVIAGQLCASKPENTNGIIVRPIMDYIRAHSCDYSMSLEMLREQFGYGITQLSHMIKDFSGGSFRAYVTALRMEKARELLKTEMTIAEISETVGYGSVSHFIKTFRSYFGNKPSFFRDKLD